jgi:DNA-binding response OmpR family regulator
MESGLRVLVIEDQRDIAANIWDFLERRGHEVDHCADGKSGFARAMKGGFDVIVLDLGLPEMDGLDLCRRLREAGRDVPILMLTARDTLPDKVRGFAEGADDYVVKPFALRELEARVRALHRRGKSVPSRCPSVGDLSYDAGAMTARRESRTILLTRTQGIILETLLRDSPSVTTHRRLLDAIWSAGAGDIAALHTHVYELRALVDRPFAQAMIQSVHGIGYRLVAPP